MAGRFRRNHPDIGAFRWNDLLEVDVETVRPDQRLAGGHLGKDVLLEDATLLFVRNQHDDDVGLSYGVRDLGYLEASLFGLGPGLRALVEADHDVQARIA